jgi:pectinesterase
LLLALLALGSCKDKDALKDVAPEKLPEVSITFDVDSLAVDLSSGKPPAVTGTVASVLALKSVAYYVVDSWGELLPIDTVIRTFANAHEHSISVALNYLKIMAGFRVVATDVEGNAAEKTLPLRVFITTAAPQISIATVGDTIKALLGKATLQVEVYADAGLSRIRYYEHRQAGDSALLKSVPVPRDSVHFADRYELTVVAATTGFSVVAENSEGALARLYKPARLHHPFQIVVAKDGTGTHTTIKAAFAAIPDNSPNPTVVFIRKGTYREWLLLGQAKKNVILVGEDRDSSIITYDAAAPNPYPSDGSAPKGESGGTIGTMGSATLHVEAENFYAENITIQNTAGVEAGQAVALRNNRDKQVYVNCRILGGQDTYYTHNAAMRVYHKNCYIRGTVDFIFGGAVAYFDRCTIYTVERSNGGYVTAAGDVTGKYGYVFSQCTITGNARASSYTLGRPWGSRVRTVFVSCNMGSMIKSAGWTEWSNSGKDILYAEYSSDGAGGSATGRVSWSTQLTDSEVADYSLENVMKLVPMAAPQTVDGWHPDLLINRAENILR